MIITHESPTGTPDTHVAELDQRRTVGGLMALAAAAVAVGVAAAYLLSAGPRGSVAVEPLQPSPAERSLAATPPARQTEPPNPYQLRVVSSDGDIRVSADRLPAGATMYDPGGRSSTTLLVEREGLPATELFFDRNLEPEAFSTDGRFLFVIDHQPAEAPEIYEVRVVDVATGELSPVLGPLKTPLDEEMRGYGRTHVWSPDGTQLYTLYVNQPHDHGGATGHLTERSFVHVLDTEEIWAFCVELPAEYNDRGHRLDLRLSTDGSSLEILDTESHDGATVELAQLNQFRLAQGQPDIVLQGDLSGPHQH